VINRCHRRGRSRVKKCFPASAPALARDSAIPCHDSQKLEQALGIRRPDLSTSHTQIGRCDGPRIDKTTNSRIAINYLFTKCQLAIKIQLLSLWALHIDWARYNDWRSLTERLFQLQGQVSLFLDRLDVGFVGFPHGFVLLARVEFNGVDSLERFKSS
jgi:hypothetical protein